MMLKLLYKPHEHNYRSCKYDSFTSAKIVIIRETTKFGASSKIGIPLKILTCRYGIYE